MVMRILVAGFLGGLAMFIWTSLAHTALPLGKVGFSQMTDERPALEALKKATRNEPGLYIFPAIDMTAKDAMAKSEAARKANPFGIMVYQPPGTSGTMQEDIVREFLTEIVEAMIATILLAQTSIAAYSGRVGFVTLVGVVSAISTNVSYWNWYAFPVSYTLANMTIEIVGFVLAGLAIAAWLRPRPG